MAVITTPGFGLRKTFGTELRCREKAYRRKNDKPITLQVRVYDLL